MPSSLPPPTLGLPNEAQMAMGDGVWNTVMNAAPEGVDPSQVRASSIKLQFFDFFFFQILLIFVVSVELVSISLNICVFCPTK